MAHYVDIASGLEVQIKTLFEEAVSCTELTELFIERFKELSTTLNSLLPDVSDCKPFEIDDLLYPEDDKTITNISNSALYSEETFTNISQRCFNFYHYIYLRMVFSPNKRSKTALYDTTYLQLLEHVPQETPTPYGCCSLIGNLPKIPQAKDSNKRRVTSWLAEQSRFICKTIDFKTVENIHPDLSEYFETYGDEIHTSVEYVKMLIIHDKTRDMTIRCQLHSYFKSALNEEERLERLANFLKAVKERRYDDYEIHETYLITRQCRYLVSNLQKIVEALQKYKDYTDEKLRHIEKFHNYVIEPYLSDDTFNSLAWRPNVRQLINEKLNDAGPLENEEETPDYTIENFILFDDLMKYLDMLNIVYTAFYKCEELMKTTGFVGDAPVFRCEFSTVNTYLMDIIINPLKRGYIPWWIETMLKKCPFMFLSHRYDYLMEDLIKLLKGEHIDEISEGKLFLALSTSYWKRIFN